MMRRAALLLLVMTGLALSGCANVSFTPWPPDGTGGMAERRPSTDARIDALQQHLFRLAERNARYYAAAAFQDAELTMIQVRRLSEGGFPEDTEIEIAKLKQQMNKVERQLAEASASGKGP